MKARRSKAELLSDYVSKHMKEEGQKDKISLNPRKIKSETQSDASSVNQEMPQKWQNPSKMIKSDYSSSQGVKHNETTHGSIRSKQSYVSFHKEETEIKDELKDSQIEVNSIHEKGSIWSMPTKIGESDSSQNQYFGRVGYGIDYQNHSQGNYSAKIEHNRIQSNPRSDYGYYMRHPMNMHSQMMPPSFTNGYHCGMPYQPLLSQPISKYEMMGLNRAGNLSPNHLRYEDKL